MTFFFSSQDPVSDMKHDSAASPGISDQEKEMATNAFEAFTVLYFSTSLICDVLFVLNLFAV